MSVSNSTTTAQEYGAKAFTDLQRSVPSNSSPSAGKTKVLLPQVVEDGQRDQESSGGEGGGFSYSCVLLLFC